MSKQVLRMTAAAWWGVALMCAAGPEGHWQDLNRLRAGQKIHLVQMDMKSLDGRFQDVSLDAIRVRVKNDDRVVPRADVYRVSVRTASRRALHALIGFGVGAAAGGAAGWGALAATGGSDEPLLIVAFGSVIGAVSGAGIGAAIPGYATVYRAAKPGSGKSAPVK